MSTQQQINHTLHFSSLQQLYMWNEREMKDLQDEKSSVCSLASGCLYILLTGKFLQSRFFTKRQFRSRQNLFVCFFILIEENDFLFLLLRDNRELACELSVEVRSSEFGLAQSCFDACNARATLNLLGITCISFVLISIYYPRRYFAQRAKSQGGILVALAYIGKYFLLKYAV